MDEPMTDAQKATMRALGCGRWLNNKELRNLGGNPASARALEAMGLVEIHHLDSERFPVWECRVAAIAKDAP